MIVTHVTAEIGWSCSYICSSATFFRPPADDPRDLCDLRDPTANTYHHHGFLGHRCNHDNQRVNWSET